MGVKVSSKSFNYAVDKEFFRLNALIFAQGHDVSAKHASLSRPYYYHSSIFSWQNAKLWSEETRFASPRPSRELSRIRSSLHAHQGHERTQNHPTAARSLLRVVVIAARFEQGGHQGYSKRFFAIIYSTRQYGCNRRGACSHWKGSYKFQTGRKSCTRVQHGRRGVFSDHLQ